MAENSALASAARSMLSSMYNKQIARAEMIPDGVATPPQDERTIINLLVLGTAAPGRLVLIASAKIQDSALTVTSVPLALVAEGSVVPADAPLIVSTVENQLGARIDHAVAVEAESLTALARALKVDADVEGVLGIGVDDPLREEAQRTLIRELVEKLLDPGLIGNPARVLKMLKAVKRGVVVDDTLDFDAATRIARRVRMVERGSVRFG